MFEIGFSELLLVGVIALLVFGPERLPRVAKEAALWIKKARSMVSQVKDEIDHELQLQDLKQSLEKERQEVNRLTREVHGVTPRKEAKGVAEPAEDADER